MACEIWGRTAWGKDVVGADWIPRLNYDRCPCAREWDGGERAFGESDQKQPFEVRLCHSTSQQVRLGETGL